MKSRIQEQYGLNVVNISQILTGVGGQSYLIETENEKYIVKGIHADDEYVRNEPLIVDFLKTKNIPVTKYIKDRYGQYLWQEGKTVYHMQQFVEGVILPLNEAPDWFLDESAAILGKVHSALSDFKRLPVGMGADFLEFITSAYPKECYIKTIEKAKMQNDKEIMADVEYRLSQLERLKDIVFDLNRFTCCNTHGDYKINQIICDNNHISAIIDWTSACVHPVCWEIIRSFTYADPFCREGSINADRLIRYIEIYLQYYPLNKYDLEMMPYFFYHQILACDYYGQFFNSTDSNKEDFLFQAKFATKLIRWFEKNAADLSIKLAALS